jgi:D-alanyl-D-alanine carboxypeptidase/Putative Flp pilus-assembly TadE/G-like
MTTLLALGASLSLLLAAFVSDLAQASSRVARAQAAADAAALAAVAESGPYGRGAPRTQAARFAEANGGRLQRCWCYPGATSAQVEVAFGDVVAQARATFDPAEIAPASVAHDGEGLHPLLAASVRQLIAVSDGRVHLVSGFRSAQEQARLWQRAVAKYGSAEEADNWVARPGTSMHERGLAVDLGGDLDAAVGLVRDLRLPLHRPLANEPWHFELLVGGNV